MTLDGRLLDCNGVFLDLFGVATLADAQALDLQQLYDATSDPEWESTAGDPPAHRRKELRLRRADGSSLWMLLNASKVTPPEGPAYIEAIIDDITGRKVLELELKRRVEQLAENDRRKNEFLAMLAHELRNPLAPVRNALHILEMADAGPDVTEEAKAILGRQIPHFVRLVDDLLEVARIVQGRIELRKETVDLGEVVARATEMARPTLDDGRHTLEITMPAQAVLVEADPVRLAQVLTNLLQNAAKYVDRPGRIWLSVAVEAGEAVIRVRDQGVGIDPELMPYIFDLFMQSQRSLDRSQGGLGIGLTLCRKLMDLHGGTITADSEGPGQGSEFVVRLPASATPTPGVAPPDHPAPPAAQTGRRVLVVDDNVDAARSMAFLLQLWGNETAIAHDGPEALDQVRSFRPDVIFLDIGLPGIDGYEVARRIRSDSSLGKISLFAVTGYGAADDRNMAWEAGFDAHLVKPVKPEDVERLLAGDGSGSS